MTELSRPRHSRPRIFYSQLEGKTNAETSHKAGREADGYTEDLEPAATLIFTSSTQYTHPIHQTWLDEAKLSLRPSAAEVLRRALPCWSDLPSVHKDSVGRRES